MEHFENTIRIISKSIRSIEESSFESLKDDCIETLANGKKIIASGLGKNVPICEKFVGTLNSVGIQAQFMHTNSAIHGDLGIAQTGDLVIILSKSGETSETIHLVNHLMKRSCILWLLSFSKESTLYCAMPNRIIINLEHEGDDWDMIPNNSTLINLIVLQELAMQVIKESKISIDTLKQNHPGGAIGMRLGGAGI